MESHFGSALARIQEIEGRLGIAAPPQQPAVVPPGGSSQPFNVALAQAGGALGLKPIDGPGGYFSPNVELLVSRYAASNGLPPNLVRAVIQQESGGDTKSVSAAGAQGLMQLMPETSQMYGVTNPFDPEQNIAAGTRHLSGLLREFNGDVPLALAAYNAGEPAVKKYGGVPPFAETQRYVQNILGMIGAH